MDPCGAQGQKDPSIKEIMTKAHKGGDSLLATVGRELKADEPDWADARQKTQELGSLAMALGRHDPPQGQKESWVMRTNQYLVTAKVLDTSVQNKDRKSALAAHQKLRKLCADCHKAHRGK
jgi:hypothetical protein